MTSKRDLRRYLTDTSPRYVLNVDFLADELNDARKELHIGAEKVRLESMRAEIERKCAGDSGCWIREVKKWQQAAKELTTAAETGRQKELRDKGRQLRRKLSREQRQYDNMMNI